MEIITNTPEKLVLKLDIKEGLANSIRRSVSEIPALAIDEVEIFKNDSALYDEMLSHRLGLVPLKTERNMNEKTKIDLKLSKVGPCTVYSGDLDGNADVIYDKIPLTILGEGHKLELVATAVLGRGIEHAKYVPGIAYYRHVQEIKSGKEIDNIVQSAKHGLIKTEKKGNKWVCDLNDSVVNEISGIDKDAVNETNELIFVVESYGGMSAKDIFINSIEVLKSNLDEFEKALK